MPDTSRASKSQSQGREGWCVIFQHPLRKNQQGKPLRMRKGLGTKEEPEADILIGQMNTLLEDKSYWSLAARAKAAREFHPRVVSIFFDPLETHSEDAWQTRESVIPLPTKKDGYARVLILGSTGAGKTTLVRQILGTDPKKERFPSTSSAKTTVFDLEMVVAPGRYRAIVSFLSKEQVRLYIEECVTSAVLTSVEKGSNQEVLRHLLEHSEQRFRLSYLLGSHVQDPTGPLEVDDGLSDDGPSASDDSEELVPPDVIMRLQANLTRYLGRVREIGQRVQRAIEEILQENAQTQRVEDRDALLELVEEVLADDEPAQLLVDDILDDVESRFSTLSSGELDKDRTGWPTSWTYSSENRGSFVTTINRFSSNYAPHFGQLLTPLVSGLRVAGPFMPEWRVGKKLPRIALLDGEGLGHTPDSATSLPTAVTKRYELADLILLVDTAIQPMIAGPQAVLRSAAASGHDAKLAIVFTHFDLVAGDNLPTSAMKMNHVRASLENAINSIDAVIGAGTARSLRRHLEGRVFFVGGIDQRVGDEKRMTRQQLESLLGLLEKVAVEEVGTRAVPTYDLANLVLGSTVATMKFHEAWNSRLPAEHWTRIKALTRRLGYWKQDEYDTLRPVADLIRLLSEQAKAFIATPRSWVGSPQEESKQVAVDRVAQEFFSRLHALVSTRLVAGPIQDWQAAYDLRGAGSGNQRKHDVRAIYTESAPIPSTLPIASASEFLDEVRGIFKEAAKAAGAKTIG